MSDRFGLAIFGSMCWGILFAAVAGILGLLGVVSWRDPGGLIIVAIAFGPTVALVAGLVISTPFIIFHELLTERDRGPRG